MKCPMTKLFRYTTGALELVITNDILLYYKLLYFVCDMFYSLSLYSISAEYM